MRTQAKTNRVIGKLRSCCLAIVAVLASSGGVAQGQTISGTFKVVCIADRNATDITGREPGPCVPTPPQLSFGGEVTLAVEHAPEVTFDDMTEPNPADLVLFLNGKALPGTRASVGRSETDADDVTTTLLTYRITRNLTTATGRNNWKEVLVAAIAEERLTISTGLENGPAAHSTAKVDFRRPWGGLSAWLGLVFVVGGVFFWLVGMCTGALRDKEPAGADVTKPNERAYSLSRVQIALWTVLVVCAYIYIWAATGEYNATIPESALGLMGISLATFGTAAAVDASKVKTNKEKLREVQSKLATVPSGNTILKQDLEGEKEKLEPRTLVCKSEGFFEDITTSAEGASLHRLQFAVWTVALAVVFFWTVWKTLAMPDFDATLLGLMGISSGTYAGLKLPENKT